MRLRPFVSDKTPANEPKIAKLADPIIMRKDGQNDNNKMLQVPSIHYSHYVVGLELRGASS